MKIAGLKIEKGFVSVSVIEKGFRKTELLDSFSRPYASDAELVEILNSSSKSWEEAMIVSAIPGHLFSQRLVSFPFSDYKRVEKALPFEVEDSLPFPLDDVIIDHVVLNGIKGGKGADAAIEASVLCMMLPKEVLKRHLEMLAAAGIDPQVIVPSYVGLHSLSKMMQAEGCTIMTCGKDFCLRTDSAIKALRSFSDGGATAGLLHTIKALEAECKERVEKAVLLCPNDEEQARLAQLGIAVEHVAPELGGKKAADPLSLGIALAEQINFRKGEFGYHVEDQDVRRRKMTLAAAAAIAVLLFVANLGVKFYVIETSYGKLDKEIRAIYRQAVPDGKAVGDPVRQLQSSIEDAKRKYGVLGTGTSALDAMKAVNDGIPKEVRVVFQEFNLEGDRLKLQGDASSFESVDKIKAELQKSDLFSEITVLDTRMGTDNKVKFRLDIKLKQAG